MEAIQLSLFCEIENQNPVKKQKKPKLGRYERIQKELNESGYTCKISLSLRPEICQKW